MTVGLEPGLGLSVGEREPHAVQRMRKLVDGSRGFVTAEDDADAGLTDPCGMPRIVALERFGRHAVGKRIDQRAARQVGQRILQECAGQILRQGACPTRADC